MRATRRKTIFHLKRLFLPYVPLAALMLFLLFPFYWTFVTSVKPKEEIYGLVVRYWPQNFTWNSYQDLFSRFDFLHYMKNSFIVAVFSTIIALVVSTLAAYAFSRFRFAGRRFFMCLFLSNNMFPAVLLLIPLFNIMRILNILYTPASLVFAYSTFTIPFSVWLLTGFVNDLPLSLEEAALIDGASRPKSFFHIILPILAPSLVATGVYIFMTSWNEYTFANLFTNPQSRTIPVALRTLIGELGVRWDLMTAGGVVTVIPVCVMFFFAQKRLIAGMTYGAVKG